MKKPITSIIFLFSIASILFFPQVNYSLTPYTVIGLTDFHAVFGDGQITLFWLTESENNNAGFYLYRSETWDGEYTKINESLIPAEGSPIQGASYQYSDTGVQNGKTYYYKLEDISLSGTLTEHGPVIAKACPGLTDAECDDGLYCTGAEICDSGSCSGETPCAEGQTCNEDTNQCISNSSSTTTTAQGSTSTSTTVSGSTSTTTTAQGSSSTTTTAQGSTSTTTTAQGSTSTSTAPLSTTTTEPTTTTTARSGPCAAEAIYGENAEETELLRKYRDNVLSKTPEGQEIIKTYYKFSPKVTILLGQRPLLKNRVKIFFDGMLPGIRKKVAESNKKP